jgi:hypothetical protein
MGDDLFWLKFFVGMQVVGVCLIAGVRLYQLVCWIKSPTTPAEKDKP